MNTPKLIRRTARCFVPQFCLLASLLWFANSSSLHAALTLASKGVSQYQIVLPANAIPAERHAAEELRDYVKRIAGVTLAIAPDSAPATRREIVLGNSARLKSAKLAVDFAALGTEGFRLQTRGAKLFIAGGRPRGTLYGVYTLLEEQLGVRWFTPEVEFVPQTNRLVLSALSQTRVPALEYREVFWTEVMRNADFAARHRLNGPSYALQDKHGGRPVVYFPFVHSFDALIPPELFKEHPEYFPLIDGRRKDGYVQRCLSNPDVLKLSIARVRQWIREHPEARIISVSQNDTFNQCQCESCKGLDDAEGSPAASLLRFVNAIAADIEKDFPEIRIDTLAYQYTRKPPKTIRPRANVITRLCSIECCFAHPLDTCESMENRRFREDIVAWQPVAPLLYVWDYTPNFAHYQQPFPNFAALQSNVQFFVNHGVKGLFEQGNYSPGGQGELGPLRAYLLAKLLWNPNTDLARHRQEFLQAYYGRAAASVDACVNLMEEQVRPAKVHAHIFDGSKAAYLSNALLDGADRLLAAAEQEADNETIRDRVRVARLPFWYVRLVTNRIEGDARKALLKEFLAVARKAGVSNISEGMALNDWARKQGAE